MLVRKVPVTRTFERMTYFYVCDICGDEFSSYWEGEPCCSSACYDILRERKRKEGIKRSTLRRKEHRDAARKELPDSICTHCQQAFRLKRIDAKFCSDKCKQAAYRDRKKVTAEPEVKTTVVHCKKEPYDVYIGRAMPRQGLKGSKWKNPFKIGKDGTREEVIEKYKKHFFSHSELVNSVGELKGKVLGCWCKPEACHGDFLAEMADKSS